MRRAVVLVVTMIRPPAIAVIMLMAAIGTAVAGKGDDFHPLFTSVLIIIAGWFVNATVINDITDVAIDRTNLAGDRGRPLASGVASRNQLLVVGITAGAASLAIAWMTNWRVGVIVTAGLMLNAAYSLPPIRISARGALAVAMLPLAYVVLPFLVGVFSVRSSVGHDGIALLVGLYIIFMGRIVLKDFRDVVGDTQFGKRTFLVRHGRIQTCLFSAACWIGGSAALIAFVQLPVLLICAVVVYLACVLHALFHLARNSDRDADELLIGAIALVGRGLGIAMLAHLTMVEKGWSVTDQASIHCLLGFLFVFTYIQMTREARAVAAVGAS